LTHDIGQTLAFFASDRGETREVHRVTHRGSHSRRL
jgi:hypothetical protein